MISNLTTIYLRQRLLVADRDDSGIAFREVLRVLRWGFNFSERDSRIYCNALCPAINAERFQELSLLAELAEVAQ